MKYNMDHISHVIMYNEIFMHRMANPEVEAYQNPQSPVPVSCRTVKLVRASV